MALTHKDLEKLQSDYSDWRMELVDGEIMNSWVIPRKVDRVTGSNAGFILPNSDTRAPDVSFVQAQRLRRSPRSFAELAPDLIVEVKSPSDNMEKLEVKIESFLALGTRVGILINPENRTVRV
jgi:Uma2 family endonuclease